MPVAFIIFRNSTLTLARFNFHFDFNFHFCVTVSRPLSAGELASGLRRQFDF
jgi:hypothetical protein